MAVLPPVRSVVLTWPQHPAVMWDLVVEDADTGQDLTSEVLSVSVVVYPGQPVYADVLMITDENGDVQRPGGPVLLTDDGSGYRKAAFRFLVTEMRVKGCT